MWGVVVRETTTENRRGIPPHASAQRDNVLRLLREAKARGAGLRRDDAIFQHRITQVGTRVFELEQQGYVIRHEQEPGARFVTYFLISEPGTPKPLPTYLPKGPDKRQGSLLKSWEQVCKEREEKIRQPEPSFELTP